MAIKIDGNTLAIITIGGIGVALFLILGKRLQESGGLVGEAVESLIGSPPTNRLVASTSRPSELPEAAADHLPRGLYAEFLDPRQGGTVDRFRFFGSEYPIRFLLDNPREREVSVELAIDITENSLLFPGTPDATPVSYGRITLPPRTRREYEVTGVVRSTNMVGLAFTAQLRFDGIPIAAVDFDVG